MDLNDAAKQAAGNWAKFSSFCWFQKPDRPEDWAIIYTHNRDSGLLDQSNAAVIEKAMQPFADDVVFESHGHWAVGHVDGFSIRVFKRGRITAAFKAYHELAQRLDDYPILDEKDYSERESQATLENIGEAAWRLKREFDLPAEWQGEVYDWLSDHRSLENTDDRGGWPGDDDLVAAFDALGFQKVA